MERPQEELVKNPSKLKRFATCYGSGRKWSGPGRSRKGYIVEHSRWQGGGCGAGALENARGYLKKGRASNDRESF